MSSREAAPCGAARGGFADARRFLYSRGMRSRISILILALVLCVALVSGANVKLYLKDGTYQLVKEYQVEEDHVHYLSAERGEWEDIPLDLIDMDRTKKEVAAREEAIKEQAKKDAEEDAAIKAEYEERSHIPPDAGVYYIHDTKLEPLKQAEVSIVTDKTRSILKVISPYPVVTGKATAEIDGTVSQFRITDRRPEFYFRMNSAEALAIIKLAPKKNGRIVETISTDPITTNADEQMIKVDTFKKAIETTLYKIWPEAALDPGEYAVVEYTNGTGQPQVWDFAIGPPK